MKLRVFLKGEYRHEKSNGLDGRDVPAVLGRNLDSARDCAAVLAKVRGHRMAKAALENALWDAEAKQKSMPLWKLLGGGSTHAWCQIYLPGSGWIEFDPTNGIVGNRDLIRVAVTRTPNQAIPLSGSYWGNGEDELGMDVSVNVKTLA